MGKIFLLDSELDKFINNNDSIADFVTHTVTKQYFFLDSYEHLPEILASPKWIEWLICYWPFYYLSPKTRHYSKMGLFLKQLQLHKLADRFSHIVTFTVDKSLIYEMRDEIKGGHLMVNGMLWPLKEVGIWGNVED